MVKSPGASPERKKAKLDVYPMELKDPGAREINETLLLNYTTALSGFEIPTESQLVSVAADSFRHHPNEDVEQYFRASAQWGVPAIAWNIVRPAFLWKLEFCITEFMHIEKKKKDAAASSASTSDSEKSADEKPPKERMSIMGTKLTLIKTTPVVFNTEESMEFILGKAKSFEGFPFTWQRLCELLTDPMRHYSTVDKFLRAVDKVINVVTTINEHGSRQFGEWEVPTSNSSHHLESVFFMNVDEVDMMEPIDMSKKTLTRGQFAPPTTSPKASMTPPMSPSPKKEEVKEEEMPEEKEEEKEKEEEQEKEKEEKKEEDVEMKEEEKEKKEAEEEEKKTED